MSAEFAEWYRSLSDDEQIEVLAELRELFATGRAALEEAKEQARIDAIAGELLENMEIDL